MDQRQNTDTGAKAYAFSGTLASAARITALRATHLLDTPPEQAFDELARIASRALDAPAAAISLVDQDRQFFKSRIGEMPDPEGFREARQTPLSYSLCQYVVADPTPLAIGDAREHPIYKDNLAVRELGVVAYLGVPLTTPDGHTLGTLCVMDSKPRTWSEDQKKMLVSLASVVMSTIEYRAVTQARHPAADGGDAKRLPQDGTEAILLLSADALAAAVSSFVGALSAYDACIRQPQATPDALAREAEYRGRVLAARRGLEEATQTFREYLKASGPQPDSPLAQSAVELWQACEAYFEVEARRTELVARFQQFRAALPEVERAVLLVSKAEETIRLAARAYGIRREQ